jgi:hypothetical protein
VSAFLRVFYTVLSDGRTIQKARIAPLILARVSDRSVSVSPRELRMAMRKPECAGIAGLLQRKTLIGPFCIV